MHSDAMFSHQSPVEITVASHLKWYPVEGKSAIGYHMENLD